MFLSVALASLLMASFAYFATVEAGRIKFQAAADDAFGRIETRVEQHVLLLRATLGMFHATGGDVSRPALQRFNDSIDVQRRYAGIRGLGFARLIRKGEEPLAEAEIARNYGSPRKIWPDTDQDLRAPIMMLEPFDARNRLALGFDMYSEAVRRAAMEAAMRTGAPRASGPVDLVQDSGQAPQPGFLVYLPYVASQAATSNGQDGGTQLDGFVYAPFRVADLFNAALERLPLLPVYIEAYDGSPEDGKLLFRSETPAATELSDNFLVSRPLEVAGRPWTILFRPTAGFSQPTSAVVPIMLGLFGLLLAGALTMVARYQSRAHEAAALLHEAMEKSLLDKDLMLQEMKHRIKNSITRVLAIARQTASHSKDIEEFSASFSARLQAMAASQDMLTRSRWQKADLGELLRIELGQVFGKDLPDGALAGPQVLLDEKTTQALGLTFHELATNALKYGEAGSTASALAVTWEATGRGADRHLHLVWKEHSSTGVTAPEKTGFGTKLIDMNVTRELDGTIDREYRADGLVVRIRIGLPEDR